MTARPRTAVLREARRTRTEPPPDPDAARHQPSGPAGIRVVPIGSVSNSTLNPRTRFDAAELRELADSLARDGLLQPLVVRFATPTAADLSADYEIVAGERRWRAATLAGLAEVPVLVRDLDDATALRLAIVENLQRADLDPIEEARGYARLAELEHSQRDIAALVGKGQPQIAHALSLLKLPDDVQELVSDGRLSAAHGRSIARFGAFPAIASRIAALAVERGTTSKDLEQGDPPFSHELSGGYNGGADRPALIRQLGGYSGHNPFESTCKACPFGAYRAGGYTKFCLKPDHWQELEDDRLRRAHDETIARIASDERLRERLVAQAAQVRVAAPPTDPDEIVDYDDDLHNTPIRRGELPAEPEAPALITPEQILAALPTEDSLRGQYESFEHERRPVGCGADTCPCAFQFLKTYNAQVVEGCNDPRRLRRLKMAATRSHNKTARTSVKEMLALLEQDADALDGDGLAMAPRWLALLAHAAMGSNSSFGGAARREVFARRGIGDPRFADDGFRMRTRAEELAALQELDPAVLVALAVETVLRADLQPMAKYGQGLSSTTYAGWWFGTEVSTVVADDDEAEDQEPPDAEADEQAFMVCEHGTNVADWCWRCGETGAPAEEPAGVA